MTLIRLLSAVFLIVAAGVQARAEPALWVARSATATVYLFGTVHLLKDNVGWESPRIDHAVGEAQDLWLELSDAFDPAVMAPFIQKYAIDAAHPLSTKLSQAERVRLKGVVEKAGLGGLEQFEPFRPWMVGLVISMSDVAKAGYDPNQGVEKILTAKMKETGRPVHGLETVEAELRYFTDLKPKAELQMLDESMDDAEDGASKVDAIVDAWVKGDVKLIGKLVDVEMATKEPEAYRALIVDRNVAWARRLRDRLNGTGVSFVAVGAGHLAGPDSVQVQLGKLGIKVTRE